MDPLLNGKGNLIMDSAEKAEVFNDFTHSLQKKGSCQMKNAVARFKEEIISLEKGKNRLDII